MKKLAHLPLLAAFALPMDLAEWTKTKFPFESLPEFKQNGVEWTVEADEAVGGYAWILPKKERALRKTTELHWKWSVEKFPPVLPAPPFTKKEDDYAIRVGVLLNTGESQIPVPGSLKDKLKSKEALVSRFIFYVPSPTLKEKRCAQSPFSDRGLTCQLPASKKPMPNSVKPWQDLKSWVKKDFPSAEIVGFWVFADTDNSESFSKAKISSLILKNP